MNASTVNAELLAYYESIWTDMKRDLMSHHALDHPQFISVNNEYVNATTRLMIIGMEPTNWGVDEYGRCFGERSVTELIEIHSNFDNSRSKLKLQSNPFWRTSYKLQGKVNPSDDKFGFAYSNLVKLTENGKSKSRTMMKSILQFPILQKEIELVKPQAVVFFTGFAPFYMAALENTFEGLGKNRIAEHLFLLSSHT